MVKIVNNIRINLKNDVFSLPAQVPEVIPLWEAFWEMQFTLFKRRTVNSYSFKFQMYIWAQRSQWGVGYLRRCALFSTRNAVCHIMKEQFFPAQKRFFLIFLFWSVCLNRLVNMSINTRGTLLQVERSWSSEIAASFADCRKRVSAILRFWSSLRDIVFDGRVNYAKNRNQNKQRVDDVAPRRILKVLDFRLEEVKYPMSSYHDLI